MRTSNVPNTLVSGDAKAVVSGLLAWLTDPNSTQHCTVTGGPGAGKTYMIAELLRTYTQFQKLGMGNTKLDFKLGATTHESAGVLTTHTKEEANTIYSILGIMPNGSNMHIKVGKSLYTSKFTPSSLDAHTDDFVLLCDEANYINRETLTLIIKWFPNIRIIFVGSENQLGTGVGPSDIFLQGWNNFFLNSSHRASNKDVQEIYDNSESDVVNSVSKVQYTQNPSVVYLHHKEWYEVLERAQTSDLRHECVVLAYTNARVFELVGEVRKMQGRPGYFDTAAQLQGLKLGSKYIRKRDFSLNKDNKGELYIPVSYGKKGAFKKSYVGRDMQHYKSLVQSYDKSKGEVYPSLVASQEARTIHGAQGGTWDYTFLDLTNFSQLEMRDLETYRRMKHVAESRHRKKIYIKIS